MHSTNPKSVSEQGDYRKPIHDQYSQTFSMDELVKQNLPQADLYQRVILCENCSHQGILLTRQWLKACYCPSCGALV